MDGVDLLAYLLVVTAKGQESLRGAVERDRVIRRVLAVDTLDNAALSEGEAVLVLAGVLEGSDGGPAGFVCHVGGVVGWLQVYSGAEVSSQPPQGQLHESFTITILLQHPLHSEGFRPILTETVYPLADGGPVALVRSRTIF